MLDALSIRYFQSHRDTLIEFDQGVNVIYGLSQSGKTAILRALLMLINNRPSGARYYSNFAPKKGETRIELTLHENIKINLIKTIERQKDERKLLKGTKYEVMNFVDSWHEEYSPGKDIPDDVARILNMGDINIQGQFSNPFLIFSSPGEVARTINRITQLEETDVWKKKITSQINTKTDEQDVLKMQLSDAEDELEKYKGIEDLDMMIKKLVIIDKQWEENTGKKFRLDKGLIQIEEIDKGLAKLSPQLIVIEKLYEKIRQENERFEMAKIKSRKIETLISLDGEIVELRKVRGILDALHAFEVKIEQRDELNNGIGQVEEIDEEVARMKDRLVNHRKEYIEILKRDKKCPVCFSVIDNAMIKKIEREL